MNDWTEFPYDYISAQERTRKPTAYELVGRVRSDDYQKELEYIQFLQSKGYRVISPTR